MSEVYSVTVPYAIKYTTEFPVPIDEIIESLRGLEKLLKRTPAFLEKAYDGIHVLETNVYVDKIESGSLYQSFVVEILFNGPENYEEAKKLATKVIKESGTVRTVVAVGVGAVLMYGATQMLPSGQPTNHVDAYNSVIINAGNDINLSGEDIQSVLDRISDKKSLARETAAVVRPAKADESATIEIEGLPELSVPSGVIGEIPGEYEPPVPQEREVAYQKVTLLIAASDKDKSATGWAGSAPGISDARKPFVLGDLVDPADVHGRTRIKADIVVHERYSKTQKLYQVHSLEIMKVYAPE
ncbi:MAG: hypothetical protein ACPLXR_02120 [Halothiobacillaceae bacterium]